MTYRKNVSMSEVHKRMVDELEARGVLEQEFDGFSGMVQHFIERTHSNPERVRLEVACDKKERQERKIEKLEAEVKDQESENREEFEDEEIQQFFESVVEKVERKQGSREHKDQSFVEIFVEELEEGNHKSFSNQFYPIDKKTFRDEFEKKAREKGHRVDF